MKYVLLWTTLVQKKSDKERKKYRFLVQSAKWWNRIIGRSIMRHIVRVDRLIWSLVVFFPHALSGSGSVLKKNSWIKKREKKVDRRRRVSDGHTAYPALMELKRYCRIREGYIWYPILAKLLSDCMRKKTLDLVVSWAGKPRSCKEGWGADTSPTIWS